jgi:hypothetical protein
MSHNTKRTITDIASMDFSGSSIPRAWFKKITFPSGKTDLLGMMILAELVYWYQPTAVELAEVESVSGPRKKFESDMLHRSIPSLAEQFGMSKRQIRDALKRLVEAGLIIQEVRTVSNETNTSGNVLYLAPRPKAIQALGSDTSIDQHIQEEDSLSQALLLQISYTQAHQSKPSDNHTAPMHNITASGVGSEPSEERACLTHSLNNTRFNAQENIKPRREITFSDEVLWERMAEELLDYHLGMNSSPDNIQQLATCLCAFEKNSRCSENQHDAKKIKHSHPLHLVCGTTATGKNTHAK